MLYDPGELSSYRASDGNIVRIEYIKKVSSTAKIAREYAEAGKPDRYVIFAEQQTESPIIGTRLSDGASENGIFLSLILRPSIFPSQATLLAPLAATALLNAYEEHTTNSAEIGWISNVIYNGQKIGGCTIISSSDGAASYKYLIINFALKLDTKTFSPRLTDMIRRVFDDERPSVSMLIARTVLNKFFTVYSDIKNPSKHMNFYKHKFAYYGRKIKFFKDGKKLPGKIVDVDKKNCALIIEDAKGHNYSISSPSGIVFSRRLNINGLMKRK
jgi:BirA family biotin operon repressor/biotin-[acetyl-CoA-carboxylase] ligase